MMKRICFGIMFLTLFGCQNPVERFEDTEIDFVSVYYVPFTIQSPVNITEEHIKFDFHKQIDDKDRIEKIRKSVSTLKQESSEFMSSNVHLRADFIHNEEEVLTILSDGNTFKIGRRVYELDTELLNLLIE